MIRDTDQLGILDIREAQRIADDANLDLVEIAPTASPPVVRIMDYGKFKYEQAKKERESRKASRQSSLREVRMRVKIDEHDIAFKARTARKLLAEGDKVKISVMFRAREITHPRSRPRSAGPLLRAHRGCSDGRAPTADGGPDALDGRDARPEGSGCGSGSRRGGGGVVAPVRGGRSQRGRRSKS